LGIVVKFPKAKRKSEPSLAWYSSFIEGFVEESFTVEEFLTRVCDPNVVEELIEFFVDVFVTTSPERDEGIEQASFETVEDGVFNTYDEQMNMTLVTALMLWKRMLYRVVLADVQGMLAFLKTFYEDVPCAMVTYVSIVFSLGISAQDYLKGIAKQ